MAVYRPLYEKTLHEKAQTDPRVAAVLERRV